MRGSHCRLPGPPWCDGLEALPDGVGSLAPQGGGVPLERYAALADAVRTAHDEAAVAAASLDVAPDSFMPRFVARARWDAQQQADRLSTDLDGIASLLQGAAVFGGAHGPQRYLVLAQNPAELRGTGGLWGAYAIMTLDHGRAHVSSARPTQTLRDFPAGRVPTPSEDYARNYAQYGGAGSWQNMNMTPDFPAAAQAALANYALGEGTHLDGVFAVDPFALQALMEVTGPIRVPGAGTISADNVVDVTTNRVYTTLPAATQRKDLLGSAAAAVFARFLSMDQHGIARLHAISGAVADGHLRIYSTDPTVEGGLAALGAGRRPRATRRRHHRRDRGQRVGGQGGLLRDQECRLRHPAGWRRRGDQQRDGDHRERCAHERTAPVRPGTELSTEHTRATRSR